MFDFIEKYETKKNVNINYINEVEKMFNINFPKILKDFYMKYNFSTLKECEFNIISIGTFYVEDILPLKYGNFNFEKEYTSILENEWISNDYIPFATDTAGDYFYWNLNNKKVYYISHEDIQSPTLICNSINDFFEILNKCHKGETIIPNLNTTEIINIEKNSSANFKKVLKYKGKIILILSIILLAGALISNFYFKPDYNLFTTVVGVVGLSLLIIDINRRISSITVLKKYDFNLLEAELNDGIKLDGIDIYLTKNYIISNSKKLRITKYDDIIWIFVPSQKNKTAHLKPKDIAYSVGKTPIVAYLKNKKKVTIALVKTNFHIKQIFNKVITSNKNVMIGNNHKNKKTYEQINSMFKLKNIIENCFIYAFIIFCFIAIVYSVIINKI